MSELILGLDTGGTYTDGVILDREEKRLLSKAKALTTRHDLSVGIRRCIGKLDRELLDQVAMVCLSTTLATNAIVEGTGSRVGLITMNPHAGENTFGADEKRQIAGQMDIKGIEIETLCEDEAAEAAESMRDKVEAVAISGFASVRNPVHEHEVRRIVREVLHVPVVCASELTGTLGYEERTVTAVLNAKLLSKIRNLIDAVKGILKENGLNVPLMIVKGDGHLMNDDYAQERPIDTIMSGPAASVMGGLFLSGQPSGLMIDMGGTTTDIAFIRDGSIALSEDGAVVGGWKTRVRAIQMHTHGLGGDSWLHIAADGSMEFGPQKVVPLCVAATDSPNLTYELTMVKRDDRYEATGLGWADCMRLTGRTGEEAGIGAEGLFLSAQDRQILHLLRDGAHTVSYLADRIGRKVKYLGLSRLIREGWIERCSLTPTDLLHAAGEYTEWNADASAAAVDMVSMHLRMSESEFIATAMRKCMEQLSFDVCSSAVRFSGFVNVRGTDETDDRNDLRLLQKALSDDDSELMDMQIRMKRPLIGMGAPAGAWITGLQQMIHTDVIIPEHFEVANAVGAAAGEVRETVTAQIQYDPFEEQFVVFARWGRASIKSLAGAVDLARTEGRAECERIAVRQQLEEYEIRCTEDIRYKDPYERSEWNILDSYITVELRGTTLKKRQL